MAKLKASMESPTSSLLLRIRDQNEHQAWHAFQDLYRPILIRFARLQGMRHDDAEDIGQRVLEALPTEMQQWKKVVKLEGFKASLRAMVLERMKDYQRVNKSRSQSAKVVQPKQWGDEFEILSAEDAFHRIWMQEHIWHCLDLLTKQLKADGQSPPESKWELAKLLEPFLDQQLGLHLQIPGFSQTKLHYLKHEILQAGPPPATRSVDLAADPLPAGFIPGYQILAEIGCGTRGFIYLALHESSRRLVAVKLIHKAVLADPQIAANFKRHIASAAGWQNSQAAKILGTGIARDQRRYVIMEPLSGRDLYSAIKRGIPGIPAPNLEQRLTWFREVLKTVDQAHSHGILHLDLKPENIWVGHSGRSKVLGFAMACLAAPGKDVEIFKQSDTQTDQRQLGSLLFFTLCLKSPFRQEDPQLSPLQQSQKGQLLDLKAELKLAWGDQLDGKRISALAAICLRALAPDPSRRYQNLGQFLADLDALEKGGAIQARQGDRLYRWQQALKRQRVPLLIVVGLAITATYLNHVAKRERSLTLLAEQRLEQSRTIAHAFLVEIDPLIEGLTGAGPAREKLAELGKDYLSWLQQNSPDHAGQHLDVASALLQIARIQADSQTIPGSDSPSALLTLGKVHDAIPTGLDVAVPWTAQLDRAAKIRTESWLLAASIYQTRGINSAQPKREQSLVHALQQSQSEKELWAKKKSSILRHCQVLHAWANYHLDLGRWDEATDFFTQLKSTLQLLQTSAAPGASTASNSLIPSNAISDSFASAAEFIHRDIAMLNYRLAKLAKDSNQPAAAQIFNDEFLIYCNAGSQKDLILPADFAAALAWKGNAFLAKGEAEQGFEYLNKAYSRIAPLAESQPRNASFTAMQANLAQNLAKSYLEANLPDHAEEFFIALSRVSERQMQFSPGMTIGSLTAELANFGLHKVAIFRAETSRTPLDEARYIQQAVDYLEKCPSYFGEKQALQIRLKGILEIGAKEPI